MYDLKLNESGDIEIGVEKPVSSYRVSFSLVKYARQRISYMIAPPSVGKKKKKTPVRVSFKYVKGLGDYKIQDKSINDLSESVQAIRIALRTEKNEIRNLNIGSHTYQLQHTLYKNDKDLEDIKAYIQEVVNTILPDAVVSVRYAEDEAAGYFRYQAVKVHIDYNGKTLDEFVF